MQEESIIADRLQQIRRKHGKTQNEFAESLNVTARAYKNYEYSISEPPLSMIKSIITNYNEDPWWLMFGGKTRNQSFDFDTISRLFDEYLDITEGIDMPREKKRLLLETILKNSQQVK